MLPNCLYSSHINFRGPAGTCSYRPPRICHDAMPSLHLGIRIPKPDTSHPRLREERNSGSDPSSSRLPASPPNRSPSCGRRSVRGRRLYIARVRSGLGFRQWRDGCGVSRCTPWRSARCSGCATWSFRRRRRPQARGWQGATNMVSIDYCL